MIGKKVFRRGIYAALTAVAMTSSYTSMPAVAQAAQATPSPSAPTPRSSPPAPGFDMSSLTPDQQKALQLAIIKTSQNPVGNITVVPLQNNFNYGVGPYTRLQYNLNIQPVFPIMLSSSWNLISRTIIPIVNQPSSAPPAVCATPLLGCPSTIGLSDVQQQFFFAPKTKPDQIIWGLGPIFQIPTAAPNTLGSGKWSAGPDAVVLIMPGKWVIGALGTQLWSFAGMPNRPNVSSSLVQPFVNYNLKDGWAISTAPIMTVNSILPGTKWTVPVGGGVAKTFKYNGQLMSVGLLYYTNVVRAAGSPQTTLRLSWSLLWPVKRGTDIQQLLQEAK
jgi:hypothetical protein